jgi:hypothetical protein
MAPEPLAGFRTVGVEEASNAKLTASDPDEHAVAHNERRPRRAVPECVVDHFRLPIDGAGLAVEGEELRVEGRHEDAVA